MNSTRLLTFLILSLAALGLITHQLGHWGGRSGAGSTPTIPDTAHTDSAAQPQIQRLRAAIARDRRALNQEIKNFQPTCERRAEPLCWNTAEPETARWVMLMPDTQLRQARSLQNRILNNQFQYRQLTGNPYPRSNTPQMQEIGAEDPEEPLQHIQLPLNFTGN